MRISYNITGGARKSLVGAISQELNVPVKYQGAPTFSYEAGSYTIDKAGTVTGEDNRELVADLQGIHGFVPVSEVYDALVPEAPTEDEIAELEESRRQEAIYRAMGENGMRADDVPEHPAGLTIEYPMEQMTETAVDNLRKLVAAKAPLLKAAVGAEALPIIQLEDRLQFPWFPYTEGSQTNAYACLVTRLCATAREKKRVTAKAKAVDGSPKYAMRCFLLALGFIGEEYKETRKILLSNFTGSSAFRNGGNTDGR